jgi:hypothetical protein
MVAKFGFDLAAPLLINASCIYISTSSLPSIRRASPITSHSCLAQRDPWLRPIPMRCGSRRIQNSQRLMREKPRREQQEAYQRALKERKRSHKAAIQFEREPHIFQLSLHVQRLRTKVCTRTKLRQPRRASPPSTPTRRTVCDAPKICTMVISKQWTSCMKTMKTTEVTLVLDPQTKSPQVCPPTRWRRTTKQRTIANCGLYYSTGVCQHPVLERS